MGTVGYGGKERCPIFLSGDLKAITRLGRGSDSPSQATKYRVEVYMCGAYTQGDRCADIPGVRPLFPIIVFFCLQGTSSYGQLGLSHEEDVLEPQWLNYFCDPKLIRMLTGGKGN